MILSCRRPNAPVASGFRGSARAGVGSTEAARRPQILRAGIFRDERLLRLIGIALLHTPDVGVAIVNVKKTGADSFTETDGAPALA